MGTISSFLVTPAGAPAPGPLELAPLGPDERLDVAARRPGSAELAHGLAGVAAPLQQHRVLPRRRLRGQLVEGQDAATVLQQAIAGLLGHVEGGHLWRSKVERETDPPRKRSRLSGLPYREPLGNLEDPVVLRDGSDDDGDLALPALLAHVPGESGQGERGPVDARHEEAAQDDAVELGVGAAGQEAVQLNEKRKRESVKCATRRIKA